MASDIDVVVTNHGSVFLFDLRTEAAREWVEANVHEERSYLGTALAVEHRFARDLARVMRDDGLNIE